MRFGISQTLFALVALTASAATAAADEPPDHEEPPAVETLDSAARDPNVSTIHGQLVPVGDHNQYYYAFKPWNVSTNPIGAMIGLYSLSASYAVHQNLALKADLTYYSPIESSVTGFEVNLSAPLYLRRAYQGAFVEPGVMLRRLDDDHSDGTTSTHQEVGPEVLLGWHWTWDSGLNAAVAFGVGRNFGHHEDSSDSSDATFVNGYLRVGYSF